MAGDVSTLEMLVCSTQLDVNTTGGQVSNRKYFFVNFSCDVCTTPVVKIRSTVL